MLVSACNFLCLLQVAVDNDSYLHVRIYKTLQDELYVHGVLQQKKLDDEIEYFERDG